LRLQIWRGKILISISEAPGIVTAHFGDSTSTSGSLLVGADSIRSVVRTHLFREEQAALTALPLNYFNFIQVNPFPPPLLHPSPLYRNTNLSLAKPDLHHQPNPSPETALHAPSIHHLLLLVRSQPKHLYFISTHDIPDPGKLKHGCSKHSSARKITQ